MKLAKPFLIRFLIVILPLLGLYAYAQIAFRENRASHHPTDVGLSIAFLLIFMLFLMFVGFIVDLFIRIRRKQRQLAWIDALFLFLFITPITYIGCLIASRDCFCKWLIDTIDFVR
jgi:hypothetical protein